MTSRVITLTTDFGYHDPYVGVMKGVILKINPRAQIVDLTHGVKSHCILSGAYQVYSAYYFFPRGTIHLVVIDPGVGGGRRAIVVKTDNYCFIGPDNGVLTLVLDEERPRKIVEISNQTYSLPGISSTFHGRDIFSPAAAHLSLGIPVEDFGPPIPEIQELGDLFPQRRGQKIIGRVVHIDRFGNMITNVRERDVPQLYENEINLSIRGHKIRKILSSYEEGTEGVPFALWGSTGFLEISLKQNRASESLGMNIGDQFEVVFQTI